MLLCCKAQRTRPELVIFERNLLNRIAPGRRSPVWSFANAITKLLGTKLARLINSWETDAAMQYILTFCGDADHDGGCSQIG